MECAFTQLTWTFQPRLFSCTFLGLKDIKLTDVNTYVIHSGPQYLNIY